MLFVVPGHCTRALKRTRWAKALSKSSELRPLSNAAPSHSQDVAINQAVGYCCAEATAKQAGLVIRQVSAGAHESWQGGPLTSALP